MNFKLFEQINLNKDNFSKGQRLISDFIEKNYDKVAFMTAAKLGTSVGVSESTVVRFAVELGYSGYPELQKSLQEMIKTKLTFVERLELTSSTVKKEDLLDYSLDLDLSILKNIKENISHVDFTKSLKEISTCKNIYIVAGGSSVALATLLHHYFSLMFDRVVLLDYTGEAQILQQLVRINSHDAVIGISFPRYSKRVIKALEFAKGKKACSVAITDTEFSPLATAAKHVLTAKSDVVSFVDSLVAPLSLINALILSVAIERKGYVKAHLQALEEIWDEYKIYEKADDISS